MSTCITETSFVYALALVQLGKMLKCVILFSHHLETLTEFTCI